MEPIRATHGGEPGLVVVDIATADDTASLVLQELLADRGGRPRFKQRIEAQQTPYVAEPPYVRQSTR
ncbi:DUF6207 family protein [Streptomyces sp. NPDC048411]|uniref:DUF6207 family protein n=1 Tax=Streptomyces sp. NPDC048411 TaxID=3157206 RepID=UPI0034524E19